MGKVVTAAGAVTVLLLTLSGCTESPPLVPPVPAPSDTPVFASDEEALAAAEAAYAKYLEVSDAITADGGGGGERLSGLVTVEQLTAALDRFEKFQATGNRTQGSTGFDSASLQRWDDFDLGIYLCLDVSGVRVLDLGGVDVTPADRPNRIPLEIAFQLDNDGGLVLASSDVWGDGDYCAR